ncbi:MAG: GNAT family N-acetyltransferase [Gemmatimonadaceae bacterium]
MVTALSTLRIRVASVADAPLLAELAARTFVETFAAENRAEDMTLHVARRYGVEIQGRELADPALTYLIAEVDGAVAGYALVRAGPAPPCVTGPAPVEIWRFYVDRPWHGSGVAQALMTACESEARRRGGRTLWLGVWERNARARRFYEKSGFRDVGAKPFLLGTDAQTDRIMARDLDEGSIRPNLLHRAGDA